jgi:hypothetical protein
MGIDFRFDEDTKRLIVTVTGVPTLEDFRKVMTTITTSDEFPADTDTIWDLRGIDPKALSEDLLRSIVSARKGFPSRHATRVAHVADGDLAYGMMRMYEALAEAGESTLPQRFAVFRTFEEAETWLEGPSDPGD